MSHSLRIVRLGALYSGFALLAFCATSHLASAATICVNPGGTSGCKATISAAVAIAAPGDTVQVAVGTYQEQVTITQNVSLIAADPANPPTINAVGQNNGIFINGMAAAPGYGVAHVLISGFNIHNAKYEGILIANASDVSVVHNHVYNNNLALDLSTSPVSCPGIPAFETNEAADCGEGIHLMAAYHATIIHNTVNKNSGGILTTDETGPSYSNLILGNSVHDNPYACGITLASHPPATSVIPGARGPFQIYHNTISGNESSFNGLGIPGAGAGVGIFAAGPGNGSYGNVVIKNNLHNNGLPGVTMHNHASFPGTPNANLNDNVITGNTITANAADIGDAATSGPTGINIYSTVPVSGTVITENVIDTEDIAIAFKIPSGVSDAHFNNIGDIPTGVENLGGASTINATANWWNCAGGPGTVNCANVTGPGISFAPSLTVPFE